MTVFFKKLDEKAKVPTQGSPYAAGFDLYALEDTFIKKGDLAKIRTGIALDIPNNTFIKIEDRSSLAVKGLRTGAGVVDNDFLGELHVVIHNISNSDNSRVGIWDKGYQIKAGDKIAQMIVLPMLPIVFRETTEIDKTTERGTNGFGGHSGR